MFVRRPLTAHLHMSSSTTGQRSEPSPVTRRAAVQGVGRRCGGGA
ncbi:hypothetical protein BN2537_11195 [Streptomyces venezuelae]|nr:hypothetical protein BN2537_11195 [Streptomyces venezuelae]